jgi:hypothetical protein
MGSPIPQVSFETLAAQKVLDALKVGETATYDALRVAIGRDPQVSGRGLIATARRRLMRESNKVFGADPGKGLRRLSDVEMIAEGDNVVQRVRRAAKRGMAVVLSVENFAGLPEDMKLRHNATAVVLGSVAVLTGKPQRRKLTGKIAQAKALTEEDVKAIAETI